MAGIHALEAAYMINDGTGTPVQLSAQQALDCYNVGSCQWGNAAEMMYRATFQPITTEANYPLYSDKTGATGASGGGREGGLTAHGPLLSLTATAAARGRQAACAAMRLRTR